MLVTEQQKFTVEISALNKSDWYFVVGDVVFYNNFIDDIPHTHTEVRVTSRSVLIGLFTLYYAL